MNQVLTTFFTQNYNQLLKISNEYTQRYNYQRLDYRELVNELFLHITEKQSRINKMIKMIAATAETINFAYKNEAMYYLISIIWSKTSTHNTFDKRKYIELVFSPDLSYVDLVDNSHEFKDSDLYTMKDVFLSAKKLSTQGDNWWKYEIWMKRYKENMIYKDIAEYYDLSTTPIFYIIKNYNILIKEELLKDRHERIDKFYQSSYSDKSV